MEVNQSGRLETNAHMTAVEELMNHFPFQRAPIRPIPGSSATVLHRKHIVSGRSNKTQSTGLSGSSPGQEGGVEAGETSVVTSSRSDRESETSALLQRNRKNGESPPGCTVDEQANEVDVSSSHQKI
ncbi:unnamed protein product, partial [Amoebophrya sp. A120]